ncbi:hypothetical protein GQ600_6258 [Phytophthora cactorum]|nr:hypothetical protein GQ600_6258 [Phytophthora cactorum]
MLTLLIILLTLLLAVPSVQTSQGKGRAKRGESKVGTKRKRSPPKAATASKTTKKLRLYSPHEVDRSTSSSCEDEEKRETCDEKDKGEESSDGELPTHLQFLEEKLSRERHSKTKPESEAMIAAHVHVNNYVGPVLRKGYASWKTWEAVYEEYCRTHHVKYRVRTSKDVDEYNRYQTQRERDGGPVPQVLRELPLQAWRVSRTTRVYAGVNFTGCPARFDLDLMNVASAGEPPRLRLVDHSEWRMHNHASQMAASNPGMKALPSQGDVVDTVAALHDSNASSSKIARYISEKLGSLFVVILMFFHVKCRPVTSQVARNFIRKIQGGSTAQSRLKLLLDTLLWRHGHSRPNGRDVWYRSADCDAEVGVQTMGLDVGNGLDPRYKQRRLPSCDAGSLVATTPTGRGYPVLDFMSLNEKAVTFEKILEFFKSKNT